MEEPISGLHAAILAAGPGTRFGGVKPLLRLRGEPPMTRFIALQLARSHSYDMGPAKRDFGFREALSIEQATDRLVESLLPDARSPR